MGEVRDGKLVELRRFTQEMGSRIQSIRDRALRSSNAALDEAFAELEITREELKVADEEIARAADALVEAHRRSEAALRHYRELFDGAPDGYALTDRYGVVREANATLARMLSVHARFLDGKPLVSFVVRGEVRRIREIVSHLGQNRERDLFAVTLRPRRQSLPFRAEISACAVLGVGSQVTSIRWTVRRTPASSPKERAGETAAASLPASDGPSHEAPDAEMPPPPEAPTPDGT